jgi:predicted small secreted protein
MKKIASIIAILALAIATTACNEADTVSHNISQEADQFRVLRRVVFYNGITDQYMLTIEGFCSLGNFDAEKELTVTCKTGINDEFKKHFLGLSDNVTYFVEQLESANVDPDHYKVIFKPSLIIPDIEVD